MGRKPHTDRKLFAIVRFDLFHKQLGDHVASVVRICESERRAVEEQARLNTLNAAKGCVYVVQAARYDETE